MAPDRQDANAAGAWAGSREANLASRSRLVVGLGAHAIVHRYLMRVLRQPSMPLHVGDADCGTGERCRLWAAGGHRAYGVATHPRQVALARRSAFDSAIEIVYDIGGPTALPWPGRCMDLVFAPCMDENDAQAWVCVAELARVLKPGGVLVLAWPTHCRLRAALASRLGLPGAARRDAEPAVQERLPPLLWRRKQVAAHA